MLDVENLTSKTVSFLRARDPSILAWNRHGLAEVRVNLAKELLNDATGSTNNEDVEQHHVPVFLRIKGGILFDDMYVIKGNELICKIPEGSHVLRNIKDGAVMTRTYAFTNIFGPETKQIEMFSGIKAKILDFINGKNCTLLTYGASGSGKTFTITGTPEEPGLIPRTLEYIFRTVPQLKEPTNIVALPNGQIKTVDELTCQMGQLQKSTILKAKHIDRTVHIKTYREMQQRLSHEPVGEVEDDKNISVSMWVSFAEIYNEQIYDLLRTSSVRPKLRLGQMGDSHYIKDLTNIHVSSGIEAYQIFQYGLHHLKIASTSVNKQSSRSHGIFSIKLIQISEVESGVICSTFNFCDLAGSERVGKTMNIGSRLKESQNINTSLLVLGRCISNIRSTQQLKPNQMVPYRESKLTQLLQKALSGMEDIMMIVNLNPSRDMFDESHHVLNFSAMAKEIIVEEQQPKVKKMNRFSQYMARKHTSAYPPFQETEEDEKDVEIEKLKCLVSDLYTELEAQKHRYREEYEAERVHIINGYKGIMETMKENFAREEARIKEKAQKQCDEKIDKLIRYYTAQLEEPVIVISSSSDDEDDSPSSKEQHFQTINTLETIVSEQTNKINLLEQELGEIQSELDRLKKENESIPKLRDQNKIVEEEIKELKMTLEVAEVEYAHLESELEEKEMKCKKLESEKMQLQEKIEELEMFCSVRISNENLSDS